MDNDESKTKIKAKKIKNANLVLYFFGDTQVGKTQIIDKYINNEYAEYIPSKILNVHKKNINFEKENIIWKINLKICDFIGDFIFSNFMKIFLRESGIFILVYDVTNRKSFNNLTNWLEIVYNYRKDIIIIVIGNKNDLNEAKVVSTEEGKNFSNSIDALFFEISALNNEKIEYIFNEIISYYYILEYSNHEIDKKDIHKLNFKKNVKETKTSCVFFHQIEKEMNTPKILYKHYEINNNCDKKEEENNINKLKENGKIIIKYTNGDKYQGNIENNLKNGFGIMEYDNGLLYKGEWKDDEINGKGILEYKNYFIYDGEWDSGKLINGEIKIKDKIIYIENGNIKIEKIKILLIGDSSVGKSSVIEIMKDNEIIELIEINGNQISKDISLDDIKIIIFLYDITNKNSFTKVNIFYEKINEKNKSNQILFYIIGNKSDLNENRQISQLESEKYSKSINAKFNEFSTLNNNEVSEIFNKIFKNYNKRKEEGIIFYKYKECYFGELNKCKREGYGILIDMNKFTLYSGNWENDLKNGEGIFIFGSIFIVKGKWKNNEFFEGNLEGCNIYQEGYFSTMEDLISGKMKFKNLNIEANFSKDSTHDIKMGNGNTLILEQNNNNGKIKYNNGNYYIGEIAKFKREGKGIMFINKEYLFESKWENDELIDNKGIIFYNNGDLYDGEFVLKKDDNENNDLTEEQMKDYNIKEKINYIKNNFPKNMEDIYSFTIYDEEIKEKIIKKDDIYYIWDLGKKYENIDYSIEYLNKMRELNTLEKQYEELKYIISKNEKYELIRKIENLFCFTNKLRKYIIFKNSKININTKNIEYLDKNFSTFEEMENFKGKINTTGIDIKCKEGKGIMKYKNGDEYDGEWLYDMKNGKGIMIYKDGTKYDGEWKNDLREGYGIMINEKGIKYEGEWKNDSIDGYGVITNINGQKYEGEMKNGFFEGKGVLFYKNEEIFNGIWENSIYKKISFPEEQNSNNHYCKIEGHKNNIIAICVDSDCEQKNKFLCIECIFTLHNQHKINKIEEIDQSFMNNIKQKISANYSKNIKQKFKELKENINSIIDEKEKIFLEYQEQFSKEVIKKEYKKYSNLKNQNIDNINKKMEEIMERVDNEYNFENIKSKILDNILNKFSEFTNFISIDNPWTNEIFNSKKEFYYELSQNNHTAKKIKENKDIIKSKLELKKGGIYKLEFIIDYAHNNDNEINEFDDAKNDDEIEVGFGNYELIKSKDTLKEKGGICFSNKKLFIEGKEIEIEIGFLDFNDKKNIICFLVNLSNNFEFALFINGKFIYGSGFNFYNIFAFSSIKNVGTFIDLKTFVKI